MPSHKALQQNSSSLFDNQVIEGLRSLLQELTVRYDVNTTSLSADERIEIHNPQDVADIVGPEMRTLAQEQLRVLLLDTKNHAIGQRVIYQGNVNSSMVRPAEVLRPAIVESATSIIIAHNHPSGDPTASAQDVDISIQLSKAAKLMEIDLLDHVIIGRPGHSSLKEQGLF